MINCGKRVLLFENKLENTKIKFTVLHDSFSLFYEAVYFEKLTTNVLFAYSWVL